MKFPFDSSRSLLALQLMGLAWFTGFCGGPTTAQGSQQTSEDATEILGRRSAIQLGNHEPEWVRVASETQVYEQPSKTSTVIEIFAEPIDLEILERQGAWVRIQFRGWLGWLVPDGEAAGANRGVPLQYTPDEERLLRARSILDDDIEATRLGPFELFTDVNDAKLLERLSEVATKLPDAYKQRFGLDPGAKATEVIVLFSRHEDYVRFESGEPDIAGTGTRGYTGRGISVLSVGDDEVDSTTEILVHELTHILNRRVFGMNSPAWVEEGLADDLAYCKVSPDGRLRLGTLGGVTSRNMTSDVSGRYRIDFEITGGRSMLANLLSRWGDAQRPSLVELLEMPWIEFIQPEVRSLHYAESAFLVRYLFDSKKAAYGQSLHEYLQALATSGMPQGETLWSYTDEDPEKVESAYFKWLRKTATANGL